MISKLKNIKFEYIILSIIYLIYGYLFYLINKNPIDLPLNDELWLLLDISRNDFNLSIDELFKDKGGTKWPLYKFLFALSANHGWQHDFFIASGFISSVILLFAVLYILKKSKIEF